MQDQNALAAQIIPLYQSHARQWDDVRREQDYQQGWLERFMALLPARGTILDVGCGSGLPIAGVLIQHHFQLTGIDSALAMLELAQARFPQHIWQQADMRSLNLAQQFDGILAWDSFFHLTHQDQREMFGIFQQHAKTGTVLMFSSGPEHGEAIGEFEGELLYHASLAPAEYEQLLYQHGFQLIEMRINDPECAGHTVWLAQAVERLRVEGVP